MGENYDLEIHFGDREKVNVEVESKSVETDFSATSLFQTLDHARKQLPEVEGGVVIVKVPSSWMLDQQRFSVVEATIAEFFRRTKTKRVHTIEVFCAEPHGINQIFGSKAYANPNIATDMKHRGAFVDPKLWVTPSPWVDLWTFMDAVDSKILK